MLFQATVGLRHGELVKLRPCDIGISPEEGKRDVVIIRLGHRAGTKAGREQYCVLNISKHSDVWEILFVIIISKTLF